MRKTIIYCDMDGVVADFNKMILEYDAEAFIKSEGIPEGENRVDEICKENERIFLDLPLIDGAKEGVEWLLSNPKVDLYFLSTPMWEVPESFTDKRLWLEKHFGKAVKKRLILSHRKDLNRGEYLIDDRIKNGVDGFTGIHLHFGTEPFKTWKEIINHLEIVLSYEY